MTLPFIFYCQKPATSKTTTSAASSSNNFKFLCNMKWGDLKTIKFIRLYEQHPCLWDIRTSDYKNRKQRNVAYDEIIRKINTPNFGHRECKNKIKNIRSQYCQELKKIRVSVKIGGEVYKPTLVWFNIVDSFLKDIVVHRERHLDPIVYQAMQQEEASSDIEFLAYSVIKEESDGDTECESVPEEPVNASPHQTLDVSTSKSYEENSAEDFKNKESKSIELLTSTVQKIENIVNNLNNSTMTEFDVFGQSVAAQLKSMPFDIALLVQLEIQQLITMKRIKKH